MTYEHINSLMSEIATALKCECAYSAFKKGTRTRFLVFFYDGSDDFYADGTNYQSIENLVIEFYSPNKEIKSERIIQKMLNDSGIAYSKTSAYISSEDIHMTSYSTEVLINEQS